MRHSLDVVSSNATSLVRRISCALAEMSSPRNLTRFLAIRISHHQILQLTPPRLGKSFFCVPSVRRMTWLKGKGGYHGGDLLVKSNRGTIPSNRDPTHSRPTLAREYHTFIPVRMRNNFEAWRSHWLPKVSNYGILGSCTRALAISNGRQNLMKRGREG